VLGTSVGAGDLPNEGCNTKGGCNRRPYCTEPRGVLNLIMLEPPSQPIHALDRRSRTMPVAVATLKSQCLAAIAAGARPLPLGMARDTAIGSREEPGHANRERLAHCRPESFRRAPMLVDSRDGLVAPNSFGLRFVTGPDATHRPMRRQV
jgi:hypothetical protein